MRDPFGYKVLRTYQQGIEIHELTKVFTAEYLDSYKDKRLIAHMDDSGRSIPRNISEGYGRNNTRQYYEFLGFAFGSLMELIEDLLETEREFKGKLRMTRGNNGANGALEKISQLIKLAMGEKTMLKNQMDRIENMVGEQGLVPERIKIAKAKEQIKQKEIEFDKWIAKMRGIPYKDPRDS